MKSSFLLEVSCQRAYSIFRCILFHLPFWLGSRSLYIGFINDFMFVEQDDAIIIHIYLSWFKEELYLLFFLHSTNHQFRTITGKWSTSSPWLCGCIAALQFEFHLQILGTEAQFLFAFSKMDSWYASHNSHELQSVYTCAVNALWK